MASVDERKMTDSPETRTAPRRTGMEVPRVFSTEGVSPFDQVDWDLRTAEIKDERGRVIFRQTDCEIPRAWSQLATNVVASKYFYGELNTPERETSVRQLINRVTRTIADWGRDDGYFASDEDAERFYDELTTLCLNQFGAFNSPVWFNVGLYHCSGLVGTANNWRWDEETRSVVKAASAYQYPQGSACFIQSVADDMQDIMRLATSEAMLFKYGSGTGTDLSTLRSSQERLAGGGRPSGPVSFMRVYDAIASVVKSGGKCLAPNQGVSTASGVRTVQELAESDRDFVVLSYSKRLGRVADKTARAFRSGRKEVVALITDTGEFHLSADHPVMLKTGEMVPVHGLRTGMSLMATSTDPHGEQIQTGNHEVLGVRSLGVMDVYDIEVFDDEPDDKRPWSEHNFAITPIGQPSIFGTHLFVANTRRAAKMQTLKCWHPDVLEFIECKAKEEMKAQTLIQAGYEANFNGEAYSSVMFQNSNLSVRVTDAFLRAVERGDDWTTHAVTTGRPMQTYPARMLMDKIAEGTWLCGDPGLQYEDTIQRWHTCPNTAPINSSNPCSEYMFIDDSACNLASINLMKFRREDGTFDAKGFRAACRIFITAQEILVDHASYPTDRIALNSHKFRPLGLGYANLGSLIMASGLPYDSDEGRGLAGAISAIMHGQAYLTSSEHAGHLGPFEGFALNREPMLRVMEMHRDAVEGIDRSVAPELLAEARDVWDSCVESGRRHGFRNSQVTVLAPTGTIAFLMDCDTTGIEPDIALVKYKQLAGGGMLKIVNRTVPMALRKLGYDEPAIRGILDAIDAHDSIEGVTGLLDEHLSVFDCAFAPPQGGRSIQFLGHLRMMAAVQPFLSGAISKTCNVPKEATVGDIRAAYLEGWKLGLKALAIYRDGSKGSQPVSTKSATDPTAAEAAAESSGAEVVSAPQAPLPASTEVPAVAVATTAKPSSGTQPRRERLPHTRRSLTHKFNIQGHEGYVTVGFYPDGRPGEVFITMAKEGSTIGGLMDVLGTSISIGLQYGVPLEVFVNKFAHSRFEPAGFTQNPDIPIAKSVADYIFRWLGMEFIPGYREANAPQRPAEGPPVVGATVVKVNGHRSATIADLEHAEAIRNAHHGNPSPRSVLSPLEHGLEGQEKQFAHFQSDAPACDNCGALTVRCGTCYRCFNCGNSMGCS